jgi:hypothetical protein
MQLPMWHFREQVLEAVDGNQVVIVCGETGWCDTSMFNVPKPLTDYRTVARALRFLLSY